MEDKVKERRSFKRYPTAQRVDFQIVYKVKTKVKYQVLENKKGKASLIKYSAFTKNVSAGGICFVSAKKLDKGNILYIEISSSNRKEPIHMIGEVGWSHATTSRDETGYLFDTGVRCTTINGVSVYESVYFNKTNRILWSAVLDAFFSNAAALKQK